MDIIELIAVIILVAAIVFLVYYYVQTVNNGSINIKEVLKFSPLLRTLINPMLTLQMHFQEDWIPSWMKEVRN